MKIGQLLLNGKRAVAIQLGTTWQLIDSQKVPWAQSVQAVVSKFESKGVAFDDGDFLGPLSDAELADAKFLAPIQSPEKLICIGKNYADHAKETGSEPPEIPIVFGKFPSTIIGHQDKVILPPISQKVDFEAELVVVIGKPGRDIPRSEALSHVFGYTVGNDISARDWQAGRPGGQWLLGKTFDTFAPLGPWIVTADEIPDPTALNIRLELNGQEMQSANTRDMIFPVDFLIAHLSKFFRLSPGDLIYTGTPAGVGMGRDPKVFLKDGDILRVEIEKIGILQNAVASS